MFAGCAQKQDRAGRQSPQAAIAQATATTVSNVVSTATGSNGNNGRRRIPRAMTVSEAGIKPNGRGGYDVSARQQAALRQAHAYRDRYGVIDRTPKPTGRPTTRPASR
jgi:hypothetical protein